MSEQKTTEIAEFDAIRPYEDAEVRPCIDRLLADNEFIDTVLSFKFPSALRFAAPVLRGSVRSRLAREFAGVDSVAAFQLKMESYIQRIFDKTVTAFTSSGLENLDPTRAHLFISNHRDIAMDPAFVNWALFKHGCTTLRIAIGDNLLTKPFASDLMRLNKSFIVKRSVTNRREKLQVAKTLSRYIHHSVLVDNENVWIAQREGRAKDGLDATNPAIVSMLTMSRDKDTRLSDFVRDANIIPVTVSYEYDPCDQLKANEIYIKKQHGDYQKQEHEDVASIARGISGFKGKVHLSFGQRLSGEYESIEDIVSELDQKINRNYVLHLSNCFAYEELEKKSPLVKIGAKGIEFTDHNWNHEREQFVAHLASVPARLREIVLKGYANPVYRALSAQ